eukprot:4678213-Pleurochrysis_carterae.AAC.1
MWLQKVELNSGCFGGASERSRGQPLSTYSKRVNTGKSKVKAARANGVLQNTLKVSSVRTFPDAQINSQPAINGQSEAAKGA